MNVTATRVNSGPRTLARSPPAVKALSGLFGHWVWMQIRCEVIHSLISDGHSCLRWNRVSLWKQNSPPNVRVFPLILTNTPLHSGLINWLTLQISAAQLLPNAPFLFKPVASCLQMYPPCANTNRFLALHSKNCVLVGNFHFPTSYLPKYTH